MAKVNYSLLKSRKLIKLLIFLAYNQRNEAFYRISYKISCIMSMVNKFLCVFWILVISACSKTSTSTDDYLIFGHFHGFCHGERCNEIYQIKDTKVYEDTKDIYRSLNDFNFIALGVEKYDSIKELSNAIPVGLWNEENEKVFGCPDCYDQGGYFIQISKNGQVKSWIFDKNLNDDPAYMHGFLNLVRDKIYLLSY